MTICLGKSCSFGLLCVHFVNVCVSFPFGFGGGIWDLIVLVPDYCLATVKLQWLEHLWDHDN